MTAASYTIRIPDNALDQLRQKLDLTRWPDELDGAGWDYGAPLSDVKRLADYWQHKFDWRAQEQKINDALRDGFGPLNIHFVHKRSSREGAIPLLFCHGWPGSFLEAPRQPGFGIRHYAEVAHKIMLQLGYTQYVTQGGDWGCGITRVMGYLYAPENCKGSHFNMHPVAPPTLWSYPLLWLQSKLFGLSEREKADCARTQTFSATGTGYFKIQGTRPQTLGYGLADSPVALLAWIYEKLHEWTDAYPWTEDEILTWVSIYWFSRAGPAASLRIYYENTLELVALRRYKPLPYGVSYFPREIVQYPRAWAKLAGNVIFQSPEALVGDLRKMFGRGGAAYGVVDDASGYFDRAQANP